MAKFHGENSHSQLAVLTQNFFQWQSQDELADSLLDHYFPNTDNAEEDFRIGVLKSLCDDPEIFSGSLSHQINV